MRNANGGRSLVDVLSACTAGAIGVHSNLVRIHLHVQVFFNIRHDIQRHKGGLSFSLRIKRADTHQTVHPLFRFQITVSVDPVDLKGDGFDPCLFSLQFVQYFKRKMSSLRPPRIHAVEHLGKITTLRSSGARRQFQNGIAAVIFPVQEIADPDVFQGIRKGIQIGSDLRRQLRVFCPFFISHVDQLQNVAVGGIELLHLGYDILQALHFNGLLIRLLCILPEIRLLHFTGELFDFFLPVLNIHGGGDFRQRILLRHKFRLHLIQC